MISVLLMFSPLILAAVLIGFALLGGALGPQRRRFTELYILTPLGFAVLSVMLVVNVTARSWAQAGADIILALLWFFRWRSARSRPVANQTPGGA